MSSGAIRHRRDLMTVMRMTVPPDHGVLSHQSPDKDKFFVVLSGSLQFDVGKENFDVGAGQQIAVAKGETHGFGRSPGNQGSAPGVTTSATSRDSASFLRSMAQDERKREEEGEVRRR